LDSVPHEVVWITIKTDQTLCDFRQRPCELRVSFEQVETSWKTFRADPQPAGFVTGKVKRKRAPPSATSSASILPPWAFTIEHTIANPIPSPGEIAPDEGSNRLFYAPSRKLFDI